VLELSQNLTFGLVCILNLNNPQLFLPDYGWDKYQIGTGFGHIGIAVPNVSFPFVSFVTCNACVFKNDI
jgi:hypothetical protein